LFTNGKKNHATILWLFIFTQKINKNPYPPGDNQLNICRVFNLDVQYPHAIHTSMTIHMQRGTKYPELKQKQKKSLLKP
jgi:hypothetical protein